MFSEKQLCRIETMLEIVNSKLDFILLNLKQLIKKETEMSQQLTDLQAAVAQEITVEQSAITLLNGLAAQLAAAGTDPAALQTLHDQILASSNALAAAVTANTPAAATQPQSSASGPSTTSGQ